MGPSQYKDRALPAHRDTHIGNIKNKIKKIDPAETEIFQEKWVNTMVGDIQAPCSIRISVAVVLTL